MIRSGIDRLGDRLRKSAPTEDDLRELNDYRQHFAPTYREVVERIRGRLGVDPTGRPAKSTTAIVDKLRRESIRLSQLQDIAGARIVVADFSTQVEVLDSVVDIFEEHRVIDRRSRPSHGYRAIHVIPRVQGLPVEIQIRTSLQHHWAELSEKLSDLVDPAIKYGAGPAEIRDALAESSMMIARIESLEGKLTGLKEGSTGQPAKWRDRVHETRQELEVIRAQAHEALDHTLAEIRRLAGS